MRGLHFKSFVKIAFILVVIGGTITASAQSVHIAPATGTEWRYNDTDDVSTATWMDLNYDDSGWKVGPSGFSYETGANDVTHVQTDPSATLVRTQLANPANDPAATTRHAVY